MPFAQLSFPSGGGANLGNRFLVERNGATEVAFIDPNWGCTIGGETVLLNGGLVEDEVRDVSKTIPGGDVYPVSVEVSSDQQAEFSIYDGSAWRGPYAVTSGIPMAMLVRLPSTTLRVKLRAIRATNHAFIQARTSPSPRAMAAI